MGVSGRGRFGDKGEAPSGVHDLLTVVILGYKLIHERLRDSWCPATESPLHCLLPSVMCSSRGSMARDRCHKRSSNWSCLSSVGLFQSAMLVPESAAAVRGLGKLGGPDGFPAWVYLTPSLWSPEVLPSCLETWGCDSFPVLPCCTHALSCRKGSSGQHTPCYSAPGETRHSRGHCSLYLPLLWHELSFWISLSCQPVRVIPHPRVDLQEEELACKCSLPGRGRGLNPATAPNSSLGRGGKLRNLSVPQFP